MKQYLRLVIASLLLLGNCVCAIAETKVPDINGMSQNQLVNLREEIYERLNTKDAPWFDEKWNADEPVTLEAGIYHVGKDIPVGTWTLSSAPKEMPAMLIYGTARVKNKIKGHLFSFRFFEERGDLVLSLATDTYLLLSDPVTFSKN